MALSPSASPYNPCGDSLGRRRYHTARQLIRRPAGFVGVLAARSHAAGGSRSRRRRTELDRSLWRRTLRTERLVRRPGPTGSVSAATTSPAAAFKPFRPNHRRHLLLPHPRHRRRRPDKRLVRECLRHRSRRPRRPRSDRPTRRRRRRPHLGPMSPTPPATTCTSGGKNWTTGSGSAATISPAPPSPTPG